ncbi:MAG TPA: DUF433 domain-containing protein [Ktedonobacterales bacterium]|nr:DUF433 domain-containing protein [Ktedonobacterales bacterium]
MQVEEYFDFLDPYDIRVKGHRLGIETILFDYIHNTMTAEEIAKKWATLSLEQVYATILYYLSNKDKLDAYLTGLIEYGRHIHEEQERNPPAVLVRLRRIKAERETARRAAREQLSPGPEGQEL